MFQSNFYEAQKYAYFYFLNIYMKCTQIKMKYACKKADIKFNLMLSTLHIFVFHLIMQG